MLDSIHKLKLSTALTHSARRRKNQFMIFKDQNSLTFTQKHTLVLVIRYDLDYTLVETNRNKFHLVFYCNSYIINQ